MEDSSNFDLNRESGQNLRFYYRLFKNHCSVCAIKEKETHCIKALTVPNRTLILSVLATLSLWNIAQPVMGQALIPYTPPLNSEQLEQTGLGLLEEAAQLTRFQQYQLALPRAELATQLIPENYQAWALLGSLYLQLENLDKGIELLQKASNLAPREAGVQFILGEAYFKKGDYQKSIQFLEAALKADPNVPGALFDLGNAYYKLGRFEQAILQYEKAFAQEKNLWPAINNVGLVKYEQGEIDTAIAKWRQAITIDPKAAEPILALAVALYQKGQTQEALSLGEMALGLDSRYADFEYLKENLWGDRLLNDTQKFLATPQMQKILVEVKDAQPSSP